ncbi:MAG: hypothetical protein EON60_11670 [Alphaproteobacteria bacterium]|nr:MAG: hypothetical protein EON60_11670 [Alphaproteobacteria bacterium]
MKNILLLLTGLTVMVAATSVAQERAAGGSAETQMTWSTLSNQVKGTQAYAEGVNTRVDQVVACGNKGMLYAPDHADAVKGCVVAMKDTDLVKVLDCNKNGQFYNGTKCVAPQLVFKTLSTPMYNSIATHQADDVTARKLCQLAGMSGYSGMGSESYDNPGPNTNNRNAYWDGKKWVVVSAHDSKTFIRSLTCYKFGM